MSNILSNPEEFEEDDTCDLDSICPNCNAEYDEIDYEYQICHICKFNNVKKDTDGND